jgi:hypothetical protein
MKSIDKLSAALIFVFFFILACYFFFYYPFAFNYELNDYGQYFPVFTALCCWSLFMMRCVLSKKSTSIRQGLVMLIVNVFILFLLLSRYYSFANEYFANITVVILLYAILGSAGIKVLHALLIFLAVMFFWQLYLAFKQMGGFSFSIQRLNIQGTLQNSGVFSCYIVSQLPFLYYLFFNMPQFFPDRKKLSISKRAMLLFNGAKVIIYTLIFGFVVFIVWKSQSRTALIALSVLVLSFCLLHYGKAVKTFIYKLPKVLGLSAACVVLAGLGCTAWYLFNLKKLSALGRVMALDTAANHFTDHFWLGTGIGRFTWYYPQWQAQYFAMHPAPLKDYFLSAGESYIIFNEYVQLFLTIGLPGFIVFILLIIWLFTTTSICYSALLNAVKLTVISILMCAFSSYPFHVNSMLLLLACCFAIAGIVNDNKRFIIKGSRVSDHLSNIAAWLLPGTLTVIAGIVTYAALGEWQAKQDWNTLRNRLNDSRVEINREYIRLSKPLKYDGKFLMEYGMFLLEDSADCGKASLILEEAKKYSISKVTIESLAQAYKNTGEYKKAIENYDWLCNYLPNKFGTKLILLKLYEETRDTLNARKIACTIATMPVKIPSPEVDRLKMEAAGILNRLK